jgi:hypothetical protein
VQARQLQKKARYQVLARRHSELVKSSEPRSRTSVFAFYSKEGKREAPNVFMGLDYDFHSIRFSNVAADIHRQNRLAFACNTPLDAAPYADPETGRWQLEEMEDSELKQLFSERLERLEAERPSPEDAIKLMLLPRPYSATSRRAMPP